ncbi:MAG: hypothetical protein COV35_05520 [Alphaproteobacteria bacterium CG11_big_fil_rev_8_21_14_0_20_39_49]|nr:MAG: hypothetical protein COV35_05520 [Alphaproteobacteria bacterium CG11_big_fil_rev_8_21_14_0_20_39_49]
MCKKIFFILIMLIHNASAESGSYFKKNPDIRNNSDLEIYFKHFKVGFVLEGDEFKKTDINNDNLISINEFVQEQKNAHKLFNDPKFEKIFESQYKPMDEDANGEISNLEYVNYNKKILKKYNINESNDIEQMFSAIDTNKDMILSKQEIKEHHSIGLDVINKMLNKTSDKKQKKFIKIDTNKDNQLSEQEVWEYNENLNNYYNSEDVLNRLIENSNKLKKEFGN